MPHVDLASVAFEYDPQDPDGVRAGMARLGPRLGAEQTGVTVYADSGKVGVYTGDADEDLIAERSSGVDYDRGEA